MSIGLRVIRVLRWVPHTVSFNNHLTKCAAYEIFYRLEEDDPPRPLPPLSLSQVFGLSPLPDLRHGSYTPPDYIPEPSADTRH